MKVEGIVNIGVEHIHPHPENPRKNLGDVSELAESIKKNGVMQNLTVIPIEGQPGEYTAIIGHRRHAAAIQAEIKELPCRIVKDMSEKEQISTMLEENMQRNDLTIYEQAQGFQLMLDLGETEDTIAQKTGFSKTTIRRRLNIAKLDQKTLQQKEQDDSFQLSLKDLYALEQVGDIKTRNKILKEARDSRDLNWRAQSAAIDAQRNKNAKKVISMLKKLGIEMAPENASTEIYTDKWDTIEKIVLDDAIPEKITLKCEETMYYLKYFREILVIKKAEKKKKVDTPEEIKRKQLEQNKKEIKARIKELDASRKEFIQRIISGKIDELKNENDVQEKIWGVLLKAQSWLHMSSLRTFFTGKEDYKCTPEEKEEAQKYVDGLNFTHSMLAVMHRSIENIGDIYDWQGRYNTDNGITIMQAYEVLKPYGWTFPQDDDVQLLDGTHQLYVQKTEE